VFFEYWVTFQEQCPQKDRALKAEKEGGKLFVGNLRRDCKKEELEDLFNPFGEVLQIWIARDPPGFGFVTYASPDDAKEAANKLHKGEHPFCEGGGVRVELSTNTWKGPRSRRRSRRYSRSRSRSRSRGRRGRSFSSRRRSVSSRRSRSRDRRRRSPSRRRDSRDRGGRGRGRDDSRSRRR